MIQAQYILLLIEIFLLIQYYATVSFRKDETDTHVSYF